MRAARPLVVIVVGGVATVLVALATLTVGVVHVPLGHVLGALWDLVRGAGRGSANLDYTAVVDMRLPRATAAIVSGAALGTAGCMLQALLRNPLASPFVIGASQAAAFGALLAILLSLPAPMTLVLAFAMAMLAAVLVLSLSRTQRSLPTESVVLTGLAISLLFGAGVGLTRYLARDRGVLARMGLWLVGGLWNTTWGPLALLAPLTVVAVVVCCLLARPLDLLALGQAHAHRLGVRTKHVGSLVLFLACLLAALAVCTAGVLAFVGLIVPHAARRLVGPAHTALLPASAFLGAVLVLATDTVARTAVPPQELPLSVVTSLVGVPCFLILMRSLRARRSGL